MDPKEKNEEKTPKSPKRKKGETLDEKVQRHLKDKNDIITEEDLRDVVIGGITPQEEEEGEEMADDLAKKKTTTPWDILDEEE
jgi:hypothetical protein